MSLERRVGEAIAARGLWKAGQRVAVTVSGGVDSVVLLDLLAATRGWHGGVLSVVTVDHGTRPDGALDVALVAARAGALGLPVSRVTLGLGPTASEASCRTARYAAFDALDVDRVALAHHRDDQVETVLIRLLRGTGPDGLAGMAWRRDRYVRPLLGERRDDLLAWARARGLVWREDPTNRSDRFLRNRIRAELVPLLEDLRGGAGASLARTAALVAEDAALLEALALESLGDGAEGWSTAALAAAPAPLVRRALARRLPGAGTRHLDAVLEAVRRGGGSVALPGLEVRVDSDRVVIRP